MKKNIKIIAFLFVGMIMFASCERVAPNYAGVLMENYGKDGKADFFPAQEVLNNQQVIERLSHY